MTHKAATADRSLNMATGFEDCVSGGDSGPVQSKLASQFTGGRKAITGVEATRINEILQP